MSERNEVITEAIAAVEKAQRERCAFRRQLSYCAGYAERGLECPECPVGDESGIVCALEDLRR